jgi:predicted phage terminase large subunit-like protein
MTEVKVIKPQPKQAEFLSCNADIAIYGGAVSSGKTFAILLECLRHYNNPRFVALILRCSSKTIKGAGGIWAAMQQLYTPLSPTFNETSTKVKFPSGAVIECNSIYHDKEVNSYQGNEYALICFEELTQFSEFKFNYLLSRNRTNCGIEPYVRATCNPAPDSWLAKFLESGGYIDDDGWIPDDMSGKVRWFIRQNDEILWADTKEELEKLYGADSFPKSFTFIKGTIYDNPEFLEKNQSYLASLNALPSFERKTLLEGNWKVRLSKGIFFNRNNFQYIDKSELPSDLKLCRSWDRAATKPHEGNKDPDWTVGLKLGFSPSLKQWFILDVERFRDGPAVVRQRIKSCAERDGKDVLILLEQEPGSSGKADVQDIISSLQGYNAKAVNVGTNKETRATPIAAQVENHSVFIVKGGNWADNFLGEMECFPDPKIHDDQVDALSLGVNYLNEPSKEYKAPRFM